MQEILEIPIGNAVRIFEKLPLLQDVHLMRNILYGGVWQQYFTKYQRKGKTMVDDPYKVLGYQETPQRTR